MAVEEAEQPREESPPAEESTTEIDKEDNDLMDIIPTSKDLSWGLQALVGETKMFPDEEEGGSLVVSPMNSSAKPKTLKQVLDEEEEEDQPKKNGLYRPKCIITNTVDDPAEPVEEKLWSPTIAHMVLQKCSKTDGSKMTVKEVMTQAFQNMANGTIDDKSTQNQSDRLWDRFSRKDPDVNSNPHPASYNHQYPQAYQGNYIQDYYAQPVNPYPQSYGYRKELCKYFAMGGRCRKPDCMYYHDTQALNNTLQAVYEDEIKKQNLLEMEYEGGAAVLFQQDADERRKDADTNISSSDRTVYIVGIDSGTIDEHVLIRLSQFGSIRKYQLCGDQNQPTRYGFFEYSTLSGCNGCLSLDGKKMFTRPIRVSRAKDAIKGGRSIAEVHQQGLLRMAAVCIVQGIEAPCAKGTNACLPPPVASKIVRYSSDYDGQYSTYTAPETVESSGSRKKLPSAAVTISAPDKEVIGEDVKKDEDSSPRSVWTKRPVATSAAEVAAAAT